MAGGRGSRGSAKKGNDNKKKDGNSGHGDSKRPNVLARGINALGKLRSPSTGSNVTSQVTPKKPSTEETVQFLETDTGSGGNDAKRQASPKSDQGTMAVEAGNDSQSSPAPASINVNKSIDAREHEDNSSRVDPQDGTTTGVFVTQTPDINETPSSDTAVDAGSDKQSLPAPANTDVNKAIGEIERKKSPVTKTTGVLPRAQQQDEAPP